jgi:hypothetical protein
MYHRIITLTTLLFASLGLLALAFSGYPASGQVVGLQQISRSTWPSCAPPTKRSRPLILPPR